VGKSLRMAIDYAETFVVTMTPSESPLPTPSSNPPEAPASSASNPLPNQGLAWRQWGMVLFTAFLSGIMTLGMVWVFPGSLPQRLGANTPVDPTSSVPPLAVPAPTVAASPVVLQDPDNFVVAAIKTIGPAVVRIDTERVVTNNAPANPFFDDPFFREFFGEGAPRNPREYRQFGEGSGFIIDSEGILLTNAHVVSGADTVNVTLKDGRKFKGEVRGIDEPSDLAVVKINGRNLPVAPLGSSERLQVGDWAIALGNPLGLDNTVTLGIISTLNRSSAQVGIPDKRLDFIQTDAAINPGNSGGPLVNAQGQVIGINTAIRADAQGIGFAIPIDKAKQIQAVLVRGEKVSHPYLGVRMLTLTPEIAQQINDDPNAAVQVPALNGVMVAQVIPNSPAAAGGLRRGDVITQVNGQTVVTAENLQQLVEKSRINDWLQIQLRRGPQTLQLKIKPGELAEAGTTS
jgi:S1-C subfamily serine protease